MDDSPSWRPLPISAADGLPALLVSTRFTRDSYTVHVTDLAHIWSESLNRKAIYRRSLDQDTSIDPTDSSQNMQQFLSRIRSGLEPSHPDHQASRVTLSAESSRNAGDDGLTLRITCDIPDLQPLKWPVFLKKAPQSRLATELVLPLVQASLTQSQQIQSLLEIIQQKDAVMTKLLDKLDATGTRLEHIFTVLSAKQKATRKAAEEKIKGLAPFQQSQWKSELEEVKSKPKDVAALADAVFGSGLDYNSGLDVFDSPALDEWWKTVKGDVAITRPTHDADTKLATPEQTPAVDEDDDDDFQVQATPPHLSSPRKPQHSSPQKPPAKADDDTTEDEEPAEPSPKPAKSKPAGRLGAIGRKKRAPSPPPPAADGSETESGSDEETTKPAKEPSPPPPAKSQAPKKDGLGRIGGGAKTESRDSRTPEVESKPAAPRKLGQIGRKPAAKASEANEEDGPRGRSTAQAAEPPTRETSEDRANRKRDELQKELERKAAAGPARKKRKF